MARGFKLDENGDIIVSSNGKISFVAGKELKRQTIETILRTNKGEWFLNPEEGINFWAILGKTPEKEIVRNEVQNGIRQVQDDLTISEFNMELDGNRHLKVNFKASNQKETIEGGTLYVG